MDGLALLGLLGVGLLAGVVSALFGVGGGLVMVPILHYLMRVEWHHATALSLFAIAVQSPSGVWQHAKRGAVDWHLAIPMALGGLVGVAAGVLLEPHIAVAWLKVFFAILLLFASWRMVAMRKAPGSTPAGPAGPAHGRMGKPALVAVGVLSGLAGKLLGIGGGLVTVPILTLSGVAVHLAVGSSLVQVFTNAAAASAEALATGLDWKGALPLAAGALAGVPLGARIAHALPEHGLRKVFAAGAAAAALYIGLTSGVV